MKKKGSSGIWIEKTRLFKADEYICSVCHTSFSQKSGTCPACSAPMRKSKYDPSWVDEAEGFSALMDDDW